MPAPASAAARQNVNSSARIRAGYFDVLLAIRTGKVERRPPGVRSIEDPVVVHQFLDGFGATASSQVRRRGKERGLARSDAPHDEGRVLQFAGANGHVEPFGDQVHVARGERHFHADARVLARELCEHDGEVGRAEVRGRGHAYEAAWFRAEFARGLVRFVDGGDRAVNRIVVRVRPASVSMSLRVVRCKRRTPSSRSRRATPRLAEDLGRPSSAAAFVKLPARATRAKSATRL